MFSLLTSIFLILGIAEEPRVVTLAPSITQIVRELGVEPVGVSDYCDAASEALRLGGLTNPNIEAIVKLKPDFVFLLGQHAGLSNKLSAFNIPVNSFSNDRISQVRDSVLQIATHLGKVEQAKNILEKLDNINFHLSKSMKVLLIVSGDYKANRAIIAAGRNSIYGELLEKLGAENVYKGDLPYPSFSFEGILKSKPDKIIYFLDKNQDYDKNVKIPGIAASYVNDPSLLIPGLNITKISSEMFEALNDK